MRGWVTGVAVVACLVASAGACSSKSADDCADGKRDNTELGVDCGGSCAKQCDGAKCATNDDCVSGTCQPDQKCAPSAGKTCGVGLPKDCEIGEPCSQDDDCVLDVCGPDQKCIDPPPDVHTDGKRNGGETGIDCGGVIATTNACPAGEGCKTSDDCLSVCKDDLTCDTPSATDGKKNNDETDIDCGGTMAPQCLVGQACVVNNDCDLLACTDGVCAIPTEVDGLQNGSETDVDCGGTGVTAEDISYTPPRCVIDKTCAADADCSSGGCAAATSKCALPSCATGETAGIATCGSGETGEPAAVHESCCKSLVLPTRTNKRLDKYEITAGRYRTFISKVGPNVRGWVQGYVASHPGSQLAKLASSFPNVVPIYPDHDRGGNLSLTAHLTLDIDNYSGIRGCDNKDGSYSANTYWQDATHLADFNDPPRSLPRTTSDEKSMNCAMPMMFAAFCAWDGGEMAMLADYLDVWPNSQTYPWGPNNLCTQVGDPNSGPAPLPRGPFMSPGGILPCPKYNWCNGTDKNGGFRCQNLSIGLNGVSGVFYEYPPNTDRSKDNEPLIASPGRFTTDVTLAKSNGEGWQDIFANLAEYTGDFVTNPNATYNVFCDFSGPQQPGFPGCTDAKHPGQTGTQHSGMPQVGLIGATWEGHVYNRTAQSNIPATFSYGKFGARCVRPANPY